MPRKSKKPIAKKPEQVKKGRPRFKFDYRVVRELSAIQCTINEMASVIGCHRTTIMTANEIDQNFIEAREAGLADGRLNIRRKQLAAVEQGNTTMLIWMGKQYLGQRDQQTVEHIGDAFKSMTEAQIDERIARLIQETGTNALAGREVENCAEKLH